MSSVDDYLNKSGYIQSEGEQMLPQYILLHHENQLDLSNFFFLRGHILILETQVQDGSSVSHIYQRNLISKESWVYTMQKDDSPVKLFFFINTKKLRRKSVQQPYPSFLWFYFFLIFVFLFGCARSTFVEASQIFSYSMQTLRCGMGDLLL